MLSAEDNELATRVGPGTPMGELMRRYWIPALASRDLVADGEPVRLMLLGEKLIAFRDTNGKVGVLDHECPHRLASLFYGRNEEGGLRCIYHGWKFDTEGNCLDMANVPPHQDFKANVKAPAYKVIERNGLIWTYMGKGKAPALPAILANMLPADEATVMSGFQRECNWLQALEGDIDTSHAGFLHGGAGFNQPRTEAEDDPVRYDPLKYGNIKEPYDFEGANTELGTMYGAFRAVDQNRNYWRVAQFIFPFYTITPTAPASRHVTMGAWVPMDDTHVMRMGIIGKVAYPARFGGGSGGFQMGTWQPTSTDWFGRGRAEATEANDYLIDREAQRSWKSYSGITGIAQQDQAVTESMGRIANRTKEHLAITDRMIMITRRRLIDAAVALRDQGIAPPGSEQPERYSQITGGYFLAPKGKALAQVYKDQLDKFGEVTRALPLAAE